MLALCFTALSYLLRKRASTTSLNVGKSHKRWNHYPTCIVKVKLHISDIIALSVLIWKSNYDTICRQHTADQILREESKFQQFWRHTTNLRCFPVEEIPQTPLSEPHQGQEPLKILFVLKIMYSQPQLDSAGCLHLKQQNRTKGTPHYIHTPYHSHRCVCQSVINRWDTRQNYCSYQVCR